MPLHAFIDESRRGRVYLLTVALVDPADLARLRTLMRGLLLPGQRELHFKKEKPERRRLVVSRLLAAGVHAPVFCW